MVFSSLIFLFQFLPVVLLLYIICGRLTDSLKAKNLVLFLVSLIFYAWGEPVYVLLMIFSTLVDFYHGKKVEHYREMGEDRKARCHVVASAIINLSLLGFFKYTDFIIGSINQLTGAGIGLLHIPLPIGISFYTFQTMSYTIDIYRGKAKAQRDIISFGTYVALFPQLIAGPIVRYETVAQELVERKVSVSDFAQGIGLFVIGLGKKVLIANRVGELWDEISATAAGEMSVVMAWIGILAFFFQIYFDFSGYSDMAIGLGRMFGFHFPKNFDYPYMSKSITEFWRRWHISLGTWFREYVYIPLGGNREGKGKQIRNLLIVWALTGIWHGASWNFLIWGLYFGVILIVEKLWLGRILNRLPALCRHAYTLVLVLLSWVIFAFDVWGEGVRYFGYLFGNGTAAFINAKTVYVIASNALLLLMAAVASTSIPKRLAEKWKLQKLDVVFYTAILILSIAYLVDASYNPFLYFRF